MSPLQQQQQQSASPGLGGGSDSHPVVPLWKAYKCVGCDAGSPHVPRVILAVQARVACLGLWASPAGHSKFTKVS